MVLVQNEMILMVSFMVLNANICHLCDGSLRITMNLVFGMMCLMRSDVWYKGSGWCFGKRFQSMRVSQNVDALPSPARNIGNQILEQQLPISSDKMITSHTKQILF